MQQTLVQKRSDKRRYRNKTSRIRGPQKGPEKWCRTKTVEECRKIFLLLFDVFNGPFLLACSRSRFWGRGCDEALFSEKKGFSVKRGEAIQ